MVVVVEVIVVVPVLVVVVVAVSNRGSRVVVGGVFVGARSSLAQSLASSSEFVRVR